MTAPSGGALQFLLRFVCALLIVCLALESGPAYALRGQGPDSGEALSGLEEELTGKPPSTLLRFLRLVVL